MKRELFRYSPLDSGGMHLAVLVRSRLMSIFGKCVGLECVVDIASFSNSDGNR